MYVVVESGYREGVRPCLCVGLCLGLMVMGREIFQRTSRFLLAMSAAAYAGYMLHLGLVTLIQAAILDIDASANTKFLFVAALGIFLSFGIAYASKWVPGVRTVLGMGPPTPKANENRLSV